MIKLSKKALHLTNLLIQHTQRHAVTTKLSSPGSQDGRSWATGWLYRLSSSSLIWLPLHLSSPSSSWPSLIFTLLPSGNARPAATDLPGCVSVCGLVCWMSWSTSKTEWERRGGQTAKRERERKQNTEYKAHPQQLLFTPTFISIVGTTHKHNLCTSAACALIWVCLRPPSMTRSWEKRTRSEGGQERQRKSRKAVNK